MNRIRLPKTMNRRLCVSALSALLLAVAGCDGGGMSLITLGNAASENLDAGQTVTVTATIINDTGTQGASFSLAGPGTLSKPALSPSSGNSIVTLTYTAPASLSAATTATITATSNNTPSQKAVLAINLYPTLTLPVTTLANGQVGVTYGPVALNAGGGTGSVAWTLAGGSLPPGITLGSTTGVLSGKPTAYGTYSFSVTATDTSVSAVPLTQTYTLTIVPVTPVITTTTLPNGLVGIPYAMTQLTYTGGATGSTVTWALSGATTLPPGLSLSSSGVISGTPSAVDSGTTYSFSVTVTVGSQTSAAQALSIYVLPVPTVTTTSLPTGNIGLPYSQQISFSGGNGGAVSWSYQAGTSPLPASSGLSLSANGVISGTPTTATAYTISVQVKVGQQTSAPQSLTLTVYSVNVTSGSTATGEVGLPFSFHLTAAGGTPPYTWSATNLPAGYVLNSTTGIITATPTTTTGSPFTGIVVKVNDSASSSATQAMTFTISPARSGLNAELNGMYAFLLSGFDAGGNPLAAAGSFTANGAGAIAAGGVMDMNGTGMATAATNTPLLASTFSVGADGRGQLALTTGTGSTTFVFSLNAIAGGIASGGYMSEFDGSGQTLTGVLALQTAGSPSVATLNGGFAFGASGFAAGGAAAALTHRALAGEIQFNKTATPASAEYLLSSSASVAPNVPSNLALTVASNGRGTLSWKPAGGGNTMDFAAYVVSSGQIFLISTDPTQGSTGVNDLLSGQALQQATTTFNAATLSGTSVARFQALNTSAAGLQSSDATLGLYTFNGSGTVSLAADENAGGVSKSAIPTGSYTVAANGRVQATLPPTATGGFGGCANCVGYGQVYFYLIGSNQGFLMDFSSGAKAGSFDPQATGTPFTNGSLSGSYAQGSLSPLVATATEVSAEIAANGNGSVAGAEDLNSSGSLAPDTVLTAAYVVAASGRSTYMPTPGNNSVVYVISPNKAVLLDLSTGSPVLVELTHQ